MHDGSANRHQANIAYLFFYCLHTIYLLLQSLHVALRDALQALIPQTESVCTVVKLTSLNNILRKWGLGGLKQPLSSPAKSNSHSV